MIRFAVLFLSLISIVLTASADLERLSYINKSPTASAEMLVYGGNVFFVIDDEVNGNELWHSDGSEDGTQMLTSWEFDSQIVLAWKHWNDVLYFSVNVPSWSIDPEPSLQLWRSDGTKSGTYAIYDWSDTMYELSSASFHEMNGELVYFMTPTWGESQLHVINDSQDTVSYLNPSEDVLLDWITENKDGDLLPSDERIGKALESRGELFPLSSYIKLPAESSWDSDQYFSGKISGGNVFYLNEYNLMVFNGATGESETIAQRYDKAWYMIPHDDGFIYFNSVYIVIVDSLGSYKLINAIDSAHSLISHEGYVYYLRTSGNWAYRILPNGETESAIYPAPLEYEDTYFFDVYSQGGYALWKIDENTGESVLVKVLIDYADSNVLDFVSSGDYLYYTADDSVHGTELWVYDIIQKESHLVDDIYDGSGASNPIDLTIAGSRLYFQAQDDLSDPYKIWSVDIGLGIAGNAQLLDDKVENGSYTVCDTELIAIGPDIYYGKNLWRQYADFSVEYFWQLYKVDETSTVPILVVEKIGKSIRNLSAIGDRLFFTVYDEVHGRELWTSDGTDSGTRLIKDITAGSAGTDIYLLAEASNYVFFIADDSVHGPELWKTDGTEVGTSLVRDINPGVEGCVNLGDTSGLSHCSATGKIFFSATNGTDGVELWVSDGTESGTEMVKDIFPGASNSSPMHLIEYNGKAFFTADDGTHGNELWSSDGRSEGTKLVLDLSPELMSSFSYFGSLVVSGTRLLGLLKGYPSNPYGYSLVVSDGSADGTGFVDTGDHSFTVDSNSTNTYYVPVRFVGYEKTVYCNPQIPYPSTGRELFVFEDITVEELLPSNSSVVVKRGPLQLDDQGSVDYIQLKLSSQPTSNVVVDLSSSERHTTIHNRFYKYLAFSPTSCIFTEDNWDVYQTVAVEAPYYGDSSSGSPSIKWASTSEDPSYNLNKDEVEGYLYPISVSVTDTSRPVPIAGSDQLVLVSSNVILDGSLSYDQQSDDLSYFWEQVSGPQVILSDANIASPSFTAPSGADNLVFSLNVSDGVNDGPSNHHLATVIISVRSENSKPEAYDSEITLLAGTPNYQVIEWANHGSDPDGDYLYWGDFTQTSGETVVEPFLPLTPQILTFSYTYLDDFGAESDPATITVNVVNSKSWANRSVADAGPDQSVLPGGTVTLNGLSSHSDNREIISYSWAQISGTRVALSSLSSSSPTFIAPSVDEDLVFALVVDDGLSESLQDLISIHVSAEENATPVANAVSASSTIPSGLIILDGSGSSDSDGDTLTYTWSQIAGTSVALSSATSSQPTFTAPSEVGLLVFSLVVSDGSASSSAVLISINIQEPIEDSSFSLGDATGDGVINIVDAMVIAQYAVRLRTSSEVPGLSVADVNGDNLVNIVDAMMVAQRAVRLRDENYEMK
jgi:ELWxxDGT repeat protein